MTDILVVSAAKRRYVYLTMLAKVTTRFILKSAIDLEQLRKVDVVRLCSHANYCLSAGHISRTVHKCDEFSLTRAYNTINNVLQQR
jgi:hypothetical protein